MDKSKLSIFIIGMVVGALLLYLFLYMRSNSNEERLRQQLIESLSNNLANYDKDLEIQYIDVKGKKGNVTLHTSMPKDSVKLLLGKPDEINLDKFANKHYEKWGYKLTKGYYSDLEIDFENGKLTGVEQN